MSQKPKDKVHSKQIDAGISGQRKGLKFESILTTLINQLVKIPNSQNEVDHLIDGFPEISLIKFIAHNEFKGKKLLGVQAFWTGGFSTSSKKSSNIVNGLNLKSCKSDILLDFEVQGQKEKSRIGVSVKSCNSLKPTNAQLFCSTAQAFCSMLRQNSINVSLNFETSLKKFCGVVGFTPHELLKKEELSSRKSDPRRFFYEELGTDFHKEAEEIFSQNQNTVTKLLLEKAYKDDPYPPSYIFHQRKKSLSLENFPAAIFSIDQLVNLSKNYKDYYTKKYSIKKGTWKSDPNIHQAPRFGCIQFQRLGNKQNATQLQFNLEASYFNKITC